MCAQMGKGKAERLCNSGLCLLETQHSGLGYSLRLLLKVMDSLSRFWGG